ncbi:unnamed protein product, partial [Enterobius vermicularis]|uniref:E3 ubiquitin-protein ligase n=1 Tax=Enterobius vermicularis TaxID=51028 RepID=A0A0N4VG66_ENTVE
TLTFKDTRSLRINTADSRVETLCPVCRGHVHGLLPLAPDFDCERKRLNLVDARGTAVYRLYYQSVYDCLRNSKPAFLEKQEDQFIKYRQTFEAFTCSCRRQTSSSEEVVGRIHAGDHSFTLGLAKTNIERNVLISELGIVYSNERSVSTEHLLCGACYVVTTRDLEFARLQCKQLLYAHGELSEIRRDSGLLGADSKLSEVSSSTSLGKQRDCDKSALSSNFVGNRSDEAIDKDILIPLPLIDMKSALLRLSAYIITQNNLFLTDKIRLLSFIYRRILLASIVRTGLLLSGRMPSTQLTLISEITLDSLIYSDYQGEDFDWDQSVMYVATDFSRFSAQLWHECGIKKFPDGANIGRATFEDLYAFLSAEEDQEKGLCSYLDADTLSSWIGTAIRYMNLRSFVRVICQEPVEWRPFVLLELPVSYDDLFSRFFGRHCVNCDSVPRTPMICLLCSKLVCLDSCCSTPVGPAILDNEVEKHAAECGSGAGCFLALHSSLTIIVSRHMATIWGSVYLDAYGEEDRNLKRGKPLFLSMRRYEKLRVDWILQNFDQPVVSPFSFEHLPVFLRDAHLVSNF